MPKRKNPPEKPKDQFKRFLETAKEHDVDQTVAEGRFSRLSVLRPTERSAQQLSRKTDK